jgi:putative membrane protein
MIVRWVFSALHLLALGIGLGAVWARGRALRGPLDRDGFERVFLADNWWGGAAFLWIATGLVRLLGSLEKGRQYYFQNSFFAAKMAIFAVILVIEIMPMVTLIHWRKIVRSGGSPDTSRAPAMVRASRIEALLVVLIVFAATAMARGLGTR